MNHKIRKLAPDEVGLLNDFLYEAIFVREGDIAFAIIGILVLTKRRHLSL
jgi:hypothetical protein